MKRAFIINAALVLMFSTIVVETTLAGQNGKQIVGLTAEQIRWFTPSYYNDGRQRAQLSGDSNHGGTWVDRVRIPDGAKVLAHTHSQNEQVTVIEGTWYLGEGRRFDATELKSYPAGSFIIIPAGVPHFAAAKNGPVIVQLSGVGKFATHYLENKGTKISVREPQTAEDLFRSLATSCLRRGAVIRPENGKGRRSGQRQPQRSVQRQASDQS